MFLANILKDKALNRYTKCIIGNNYANFVSIPNSSCLGLLTHIDCVKEISQSKLLLFPSKCEANSNTVREALQHGCLPLVTENVGYSEVLPKILVCNSYRGIEWKTRIVHILSNYDKIRAIDIAFPKEDNLLRLVIEIADGNKKSCRKHPSNNLCQD